MPTTNQNPLPVLGPVPEGPLVGTQLISRLWKQWCSEIRRVVNGTWTPLLFDAARFQANVGLWTVVLGNQQLLRFYQLGAKAEVHFRFEGTAITGAATSVSFDVPDLFHSAAGVPVPTPIRSASCYAILINGASRRPASAVFENYPTHGGRVIVAPVDALALDPAQTLTVRGTCLFECVNVRGL